MESPLQKSQVNVLPAIQSSLVLELPWDQCQNQASYGIEEYRGEETNLKVFKPREIGL